MTPTSSRPLTLLAAACRDPERVRSAYRGRDGAENRLDVEPHALAAFVTESLSAAPRGHEARLTLHAPAEAVQARAPAGWGRAEPIDDGTCEYRAGDDDLDWLAGRVLTLGVDFEVHEPPEPAGRLRSLAGRIERATAP